MLVALALVASGIALWPSVQFYQLPVTERLTAAKETPAARLRDKAIPLGLDL